MKIFVAGTASRRVASCCVALPFLVFFPITSCDVVAAARVLSSSARDAIYVVLSSCPRRRPRRRPIKYNKDYTFAAYKPPNQCSPTRCSAVQCRLWTTSMLQQIVLTLQRTFTLTMTAVAGAICIYCAIIRACAHAIIIIIMAIRNKIGFIVIVVYFIFFTPLLIRIV